MGFGGLFFGGLVSLRVIFPAMQANNVLYFFVQDVTTNSGIKISWDGRFKVEVQLTGDYFNHVEGLCGNFNGDKTDDFTTRLGIVVSYHVFVLWRFNLIIF